MFSYYGSKSKVVDYYPPPKHNKIIEPFAGSARYSLKYFENDILLVDKYNVIIDIWKYLQKCSKNDILSLPTPKLGDKLNIEDFDSEPSFLLMCYIIKSGNSKPAFVVCKNRGLEGQIDRIKKQISENLFKIRHWEIIQGDYKKLKNECATWFVDPPYQFGGEHYQESSNNIDFKKLGRWCKSRKGQVIVCENTKADWLPFKPMKQMQGTKHKTMESIWCNIATNYDLEQTKLF